MLKKLRTPLYLALLIPALLALTDLLSPIDHVFWNNRFKFGAHTTDQDVVVVYLDNADDAHDNVTVGTGRLAEIIAKVVAQMPRRVFVDTPLRYGRNKSDDENLKRNIARLSPDIAFVVRRKSIVDAGGNDFSLNDFDIPNREKIGDAEIVLSGWHVNFMNYAISSEYEIGEGNKSIKTLSAVLSGKSSGLQSRFAPDYLYSDQQIRSINASSLLRENLSNGMLTGRTVIISAVGASPQYGYFGRGFVHPLVLDIAGATALQRPIALALNGYPLLILVWLLIRRASNQKRYRYKLALYSSAVAAIFVVPVLLQLIGITLELGGALFCAVIYGAGRVWQKRVRRVQHTNSSGLPNLLALSAQPVHVGCDVIVAAIARYEEILATLPQELHGECARQIARRLSVGSGTETIYNGEGGHFAWIEEARPLEMQLDHLEGLRALFSAPLQIGTHTFDTNIHFGLDRNEGLDAQTRVNSALASANDALNSGRPVELFEAERLAEASWELSLHARIDEGLRNGEIWLAYQSQWDMQRGEPCGAEALIRWNHPTRGPIAPDAFILQAERAGRIDALTYWVVDEAITAALALNMHGRRFQMSINLSAQMVDKPALVANFSEIVRRRNIDPRLLTIEVTETSSVRNRPAAVQNLSQLRAMGFRLSIDDFGTGEASLAYLADLPSDELKLDRRFVSRLMARGREHQIIRSTIDLAHALGQTVVAEGIEDEATYLALVAMGCDVGQGYFLGRPQSFPDFCHGLLKLGQRQSGNA